MVRGQVLQQAPRHSSNSNHNSRDAKRHARSVDVRILTILKILKRNRKLEGHVAASPSVVALAVALPVAKSTKRKNPRKNTSPDASHGAVPRDVVPNGATGTMTRCPKTLRNTPSRNPNRDELLAVVNLDVARDATVAARRPTRRAPWKCIAVVSIAGNAAPTKKPRIPVAMILSGAAMGRRWRPITITTTVSYRSSANKNLRPLMVRTSVDWSLVTS